MEEAVPQVQHGLRSSEGLGGIVGRVSGLPKVGVINEGRARDVGERVRYGRAVVESVTCLAESIDERGTGDTPTGGGGSVSLNQSLEGWCGRSGVVRLGGDAVCCLDSMGHVLDSGDHRLDGAGGVLQFFVD